SLCVLCVFFFNDTATTEIYTLSLHDALPISGFDCCVIDRCHGVFPQPAVGRSEEHTSELQSHLNLVCRLLLEKKKQTDSGVYMRLIRAVSPGELTAASAR